MSRSHKKKYFRFKQMSNYFRVPTIILSALASVASVGLQAYISQQHISGITCLVTMIIGILNSIELYLKLQEAIELELDKSKKWYELASGIYKVLNLHPDHREGSPHDVLKQFYNEYILLFQESSLSAVNYSDKLLVKKLGNGVVTIPSSNASSSSSINSNDGDVSPLVRRDQILEEQL
jgi:ABC-type siderophore export system fused ATPase/permease subunit